MIDNKGNAVKVLISRENNEVVMPSRKHGDAGYDLYIDPVWFRNTHMMSLCVKPGETVKLPTGIRSVIPVTHYAEIEERGSTGGLAIKKGAGIVDASFRGIWTLFATNCSDKEVVFYDDNVMFSEEFIKGKTMYPISKAVFQFILHEVVECEFEEVTPGEIISVESHRGEGMEGSSKK